MSLADASDHLGAAVHALAVSEDPLPQRLQRVWDDHVQMLWMKPCLTVELLRTHKELWERYTAPSSDRQSTVLRPLSHDEAVTAIGEVVSFATAVAAAAQATPDAPLATLADLASSE